MKVLTVKQLRDLIVEVAQVSGTASVAITKPNQRISLLEVEEGEEGGVSISKGTNIADIPASEIYKQLASGDDNSPLYKAMKSATGWASGALEGAGGAQGVKTWVDGVGEAALSARIGKVVAAIGKADTSKFDMPALEGSDAPLVADALDDSEGLGVDLKAGWAGSVDDVQKWYDSLPDRAREKYEAGEIPTPEEIVDESFSRWNHLIEDAYPRFGRGPMPGAPSVGEDSAVAPGAIKGLALAFLTKGMLDDSPGDKIGVNLKGQLASSKMIPTQSNILAPKSLLFAFLHASPDSDTDLSDMGGAFATESGEILDGHHRWSGAFIATGGGLTHSNVKLVQAPASEVIPVLTALGNALGRQQKGPNPDDDIKESGTQSGDLVLESWRRLAGI